MNRKSLWSGALVIASAALSAHAAVSTPQSGCHATLTLSDARLLAEAIPNARAFHDNLHATLTTAVAGVRPNNGVAIRITAKEPGRGVTEVGLYTVNLRTGRVIDDDQEPADDQETMQVRNRLIAQHCR